MCMAAVFLTVAIINVIVGLIVVYYDSTQSIYWHVLSPFLVAAVVLIMLVSVLYDFYTFRSGGYSLAKQLGARRLVVLIESIPEESVALR